MSDLVSEQVMAQAVEAAAKAIMDAPVDASGPVKGQAEVDARAVIAAVLPILADALTRPVPTCLHGRTAPHQVAGTYALVRCEGPIAVRGVTP